jgi:hypothetical protein
MQAAFCKEVSVAAFPAEESRSESLSDDVGLLSFDVLLLESWSEPPSLGEEGSLSGACFCLLGFSLD